MKHVRICSLALALTTLGTALPTQSPGAPGGEQQFVLAAGEHDLRTVIVAAASYLGRNMLIPDRELQAEPKISIQVGMKLDRKGCLAVVTQLAYTHGLVLVPIDQARGLFEFINLNGPRRNEISMRAPSLPLDEVRALKGVRTMVTSVIPVTHARATVMVQMLRPFFASSGQANLNLGSGGSDSALVVTGMVDDVLNAATTIAAMDTPAKESEPPPAERLQSLEARVAALEAKVKALEKKGD